MCRKRFYLPHEVKNNSFDLQYFLDWILLANKRNHGGEKFPEIQSLFLQLPLLYSIHRQKSTPQCGVLKFLFTSCLRQELTNNLAFWL